MFVMETTLSRHMMCFLVAPDIQYMCFSMVDIGIPRINQTLNLWRRLSWKKAGHLSVRIILSVPT